MALVEEAVAAAVDLELKQKVLQPEDLAAAPAVALVELVAAASAAEVDLEEEARIKVI